MDTVGPVLLCVQCVQIISTKASNIAIHETLEPWKFSTIQYKYVFWSLILPGEEEEKDWERERERERVGGRVEQWEGGNQKSKSLVTWVRFQKGDISAIGNAPVEQPGPIIM